MPRRSWLVGLAALALALTLGYAGWRSFASADAQTCYACQRSVHAHSRTVALVDGHARLFCCPACALSQHQQSGKPVNIKQLTAFLTGEPLTPDNAYLVRASNVNMCVRTGELIGEDKQPADLHYDRCSPSLVAFSQRSEAVQFAREHGGEVMPFREVAAAFAK